MKKVLVTVAALGLVAGLAANALALDKPGRASETEATTAPVVPQPTAPGVALWSVAGQWVLAGAYLSDGLGAPGAADVNGLYETSDAFYIYSFKINPVLQVNDKIAMKGEIRFADRTTFGLSDTTQLHPLLGADLAGGGPTRDFGGRVIDTYLLYMEWESPYGKTRFGRTPAGAWGSKFMDNSAQGNRLMLWPNMLPENWGSLVFLQKVKEVDAGVGSASDQDQDGYYVDLSYKADIGKTVGAVWLVRNAQNPGFVDDPYWTGEARLHGNYNFEPMTLEYEALYDFGDTGHGGKVKAWGIYGDLGYKMQDWTFGGLAFFASGDDSTAAITTGRDNKSMMSGKTGTGRDFNPFQILTGDYMNLLNGDNNLSGDHIRSDVAAAGAWAIQGYAKFAMSPEMSLSGYVGYAAADKVLSGYDKAYGTEAGIGMGYKLMDNLTYNAHFSYLWTGDFFKGTSTDIYPDNTNNIYLVAHALSMSF